MKVQIGVPKDNNIPACELLVGQIGNVVYTDFEPDTVKIGDFLLRAFDSIISLNDPSKTWKLPNDTWPSARVEILPVGTQVVITTEV